MLKKQIVIKRSDVEKLLSISQPMVVNHLNALLRKNILVKVGMERILSIKGDSIYACGKDKIFNRSIWFGIGTVIDKLDLFV